MAQLAQFPPSLAASAAQQSRVSLPMVDDAFHPDDVDELWRQIKDKFVVVYPVEDFDYGMLEFAIRDNNGYILQFGQEI